MILQCITAIYFKILIKYIIGNVGNQLCSQTCPPPIPPNLTINKVLVTKSWKPSYFLNGVYLEDFTFPGKSFYAFFHHFTELHDPLRFGSLNSNTSSVHNDNEILGKCTVGRKSAGTWDSRDFFRLGICRQCH